jgi:predicted RNase H-like nuclease (RuvC/YqgF family)
MRIMNNSGARQGVHTTKGLVWINPGATVDVELSLRQAEKAGRLSFLTIEGEPIHDLPSSQSAGGDEMAEMRARFDASYGALREKAEDLDRQVVVLSAEKDALTRDLAAACAEIEDLRKAKASTSTKLEAKHRGGGSYSVLDADGKEVLEKLSKADAEAFNAMTAEEQAEYVKASTKA